MVEHEFIWQHHAITSIKEESEDAETTRTMSTCVHERDISRATSSSRCDSFHSNKHTTRYDDHSIASAKDKSSCCMHMQSMRIAFHETRHICARKVVRFFLRKKGIDDDEDVSEKRWTNPNKQQEKTSPAKYRE